MRYILSLDQGTTSSRAILVNELGVIGAKAQKEFKQHFPRSGWVEHDPKEIWSSQAAVISEVIAKSGVHDIAAIGVTNQRETTILWDKKTGEPLYNAIVWQDRRTTAFCEELKRLGYEKPFQEKTGLCLDPYFSGTKIRWILDQVPGVKEKAKRGEVAFGTVDSWLIWKLTSGALHITDATNASRTLLYNLHTGNWDEELLQLLEIPREILPEVRLSSEVYGMTKTPILSKSIPIAGIAGDQQAALFGQACFQKGMVKNTYGTGCFMLMNTGDHPVLSKKKLLTTVAYKLPKETAFALEGSTFIGGAVVQWLRDNLGIIEKSSDIETLAAADSGGVFFVPAFTGMGAPYWEPHARGMILGLSRGSTKAHIARAAIESIAYQVADVLKAMQEEALLPIYEVRTDGGAAVDNTLLQFQADLLDVRVIRPQVTELTALGVAFLAGLAMGFWKDKEEIAQFWKEDRVFKPSHFSPKAKELYQKWKKAVAAALSWQEDVL